MEDEVSKIISKISLFLNLTNEESYQLIQQVFEGENIAENLLEILGDNNIELVHEILELSEIWQCAESEIEKPKYIEHVIPESKTICSEDKELVLTSKMGKYVKCFEYKCFNTVQSRVFSAVYEGRDNVLVAAPTGCGKSDIGLLGIIQAIDEGGKCIYIAPMKALASEICGKYKYALGCMGLSVVEYTGDSEIEISEANKANVIICTPEKFEIATRRLNTGFKNIRLVVIDEIHILGEERGAVIETLVARLYKTSELKQRPIRLIGLSATLPNYREVGIFLKAKNVFYFNKMYRPVPLKMTIVGFKKKSKREDEEQYLIKKLKEFQEKGKQVLIFVHSRKRTIDCAKMIIKNSFNVNDEGKQLKNERSKEWFKKTSIIKQNKFNKEIEELINLKVGVHHAGMNRQQRQEIEELFKIGELRVLVSTATLAWGVNLPAYGVIIYGTEVYDTRIGRISHLGILDVVQIFGRAGRPQYDIYGEAILITRAVLLPTYVSQLNESSGISSKLLHRLTDTLNSEIYLRNIWSISSGLKWLNNTFLRVCMIKDPIAYGLDFCNINFKDKFKNSYNEQTQIGEYIILGVNRLLASQMIKLKGRREDSNMWLFESTGLGRIACSYFINHMTIHSWLSYLKKINNTNNSIQNEKNQNELEISDKLNLIRFNSKNKNDIKRLNFKNKDNLNHKLTTEMINEIYMLLESEEFKDIIVREDEKTSLEWIHKRLLEDCIICSNDGSVFDKLLLLFYAQLNYIKILKYSLRCDQIFLFDQLIRMINARIEMSELWGDYISMYHLINLEQYILNQSQSEIFQYTAQIDLCGDYGYLILDTTNISKLSYKQKSVCFIYSNEKILSAFIFVNKVRRFIQLNYKTNTKFENNTEIINSNKIINDNEIINYDKNHLKNNFSKFNFNNKIFKNNKNLYSSYITNTNYIIEIYSQNSFSRINVVSKHIDPKKSAYLYGIFCCLDISIFKKIISKKFDLKKVQLLCLELPNFNERQRLIDHKSYNYNGKVLIICPGNGLNTARFLNTLSALENNIINDFVFLNIQTTVISNKATCNFNEASQFIKNYDTLIFKGCSYSSDYYPIQDIFMLCNGKKVFIYETSDYIAYFKYLINF